MWKLKRKTALLKCCQPLPARTVVQYHHIQCVLCFRANKSCLSKLSNLLFKVLKKRVCWLITAANWRVESTHVPHAQTYLWQPTEHLGPIWRFLLMKTRGKSACWLGLSAAPRSPRCRAVNISAYGWKSECVSQSLQLTASLKLHPVSVWVSLATSRNSGEIWPKHS